MMAPLLRLALAAALALAPATAGAQAPMLYEMRLPDGYALLRYVNGTDAPIALRSDFDLPRQLGTEPTNRVSSFFVIERVEDRSLDMQAATSGATTPLAITIRPGTFNTVLLLREGNALVARLIQDSTEFNRLRARLTFYNAALDCGSSTLALDPGARPVLEAVGPAGMRARAVNPAAARVTTTCGATRVGPLDLGRLEAGQLVTVLLINPAGQPMLFQVRDFIAPPGR